MKSTKSLAGWLVIIGAVNWGLVGLVNLNAVETLLGVGTVLTKVVYALVGLSGLYLAYEMVGKKK